jgi:hypothetical protein
MTQPVVEQGIPAPQKSAKAQAPKRVRILLEENSEIPPTGQFFSVNDSSYVLRPGEEAEVPAELVEVLDHAIVDMPVMQGEKIVGWRKRLRFPYRVIARDV